MVPSSVYFMVHEIAHMLKEEAGSEQEVQMIRETAQRIAQM